MEILSVHATYKRMKTGELERWTGMSRESLALRLAAAKASEYAIVKTCNRLEIYMAADSTAGARAWFVKLAKRLRTRGIYFLSGADSIRHLMCVCSGLDSMVIGEQEVQRQVKAALAEAQAAGSAGRVINYAFMKALSAGKEVREKTKVARGITSVPQAVSRLLTNSNDVKTVCVVGTGRMAKSILGHLKGSGLGITVCGRSEAELGSMAGAFSAGSLRLSRLDPAMFDAVVTAVSSPKPVVRVGGGNGRPRIVIDIGNPRNVEVQGRCRYISMGELKGYIYRNIKVRKNDVRKANAIIDAHAGTAAGRLKAFETERVVASLYKRAEEVRRSESERSLRIIGDEHRETVDALTRALANSILSDHVRRIKAVISGGDRKKIAMLNEIYGVDQEE